MCERVSVRVCKCASVRACEHVCACVHVLEIDTEGQMKLVLSLNNDAMKYIFEPLCTPRNKLADSYAMLV